MFCGVGIYVLACRLLAVGLHVQLDQFRSMQAPSIFADASNAPARDAQARIAAVVTSEFDPWQLSGRIPSLNPTLNTVGQTKLFLARRLL